MTQIYKTLGGINIECQTQDIAYDKAIEPLIDALDTQRGVLLASNFEYPGRYTRWDVGFVNPLLQIIAQKQQFSIEALNERGKILLPSIVDKIKGLPLNLQVVDSKIAGVVPRNDQYFPEELRSKQLSIFSVLRELSQLFFSAEEKHLGLYGAFGYDLAFQFETINFKIPRDESQRDLVLFLPDEIYLVDHRREVATINRYEFTVNNKTTKNLARTGASLAYQPATTIKSKRDHQPGEYAQSVAQAKQAFKRGDLFEVVPGQVFYEIASASPAELFRRLQKRNPSPYGFLINLGEAEYLVGASPEMFVRVTGKRIETCPISGTIARGKDAIADAQQILKLLTSAKETSELTMCTDVDRNDKSRICEPGSVKVIGRKLIEMYSRLIHTVDHVEGILRDGYDALDGFLTHAWAVTVTGAPKLWAMQFIENHERSPRFWYGGAVGWLGFNGNLNTGLTLRTIRIKNGIAEVRAGATLLFDSVAYDEEQETELKAAALLDAIRNAEITETSITSKISTENKKTILLVDHQDSFVHTLANYLRQTGAEVITLRSDFLRDEIKKIKPDLVVLSPGPGCPADFDLSKTIEMAVQEKIPLFGVCLGLQGIVEYFGGKLDQLDYPVHGKPSSIKVFGGKLLQNLPKEFIAGRYHSLHANPETFPRVLQCTATTEDGVIMAIEHRELPIWAVQFHPESILSLQEDVGMIIIENVLSLVSQLKSK